MWPALITLLLHILNMIIIFVVVYFLAYKPVSQFVLARNNSIAAARKNAENELEKAQQLQKKYEQWLESANRQAEELFAKKEAEARKTGEKLLEDARNEAQVILSEAGQRADSIHIQMMNSAKKEIAESAVALAAQILKREVSERDNEKIIDTFFSEPNEQFCRQLN